MPNPRSLSPFQTLRAVLRGYRPRLLQPRGWVLAGMAILPVMVALAGALLSQAAGAPDSRRALEIFHGILVGLILPIMALAAAPGGIREDLEQRTLPLVLVRPVTVWALPLAKGLLWYVWAVLWLTLSCAGLLLLGGDPGQAASQVLALALGFWAEFAFMSLLGLVFKRGTLWGALVFFGWELTLRVLPAALQRFTFLHHIENIAGSHGNRVGTLEILTQAPASTPLWGSMAALLLFGLLCWALSGWKLQTTPVGLAGQEGEG